MNIKKIFKKILSGGVFGETLSAPRMEPKLPRKYDHDQKHYKNLHRMGAISDTTYIGYLESLIKVDKMIIMSPKEIFYEKSIDKLREIYQELRSDVADQCDNIERGIFPSEDIAEHRHIKWEHNGVYYMYDTYTTLVEWEDGEGDWHTIEKIDYIN